MMFFRRLCLAGVATRDPNGMKVELACFKFETPDGFRDADVLLTAHRMRIERGDHHITEDHLVDAIESLMRYATPTPSTEAFRETMR